MEISKVQILRWLVRTRDLMVENQQYLTELDAAIGDADHGLNVARGFTKVVEKLTTLPAETDIGNIFKNVAMVLISTVGGASGSLYGTFFLKSGQPIMGKQEITSADMLHMLEAGVKGVKDRGHAQVGDKTMIDVLEPLIDDFKKIVDEGGDIIASLKELIMRAQKYCMDTKPLIAKKGRASYLGERSVGHIDPGSASSYLIFRALYEVLNDI